MTKLKIASKLHIMIIVTSLVVAIGIAVGVICHFVGGGYFNYAGDYKSYQSVTVSYAYIDFDDSSEVEKVCEKAFDAVGVHYYDSVTVGDNSGGSELVYKFSKSVSEEKLQAAVAAINAVMPSEELSFATLGKVEAKLGGDQTLIFGAVAVSVAIAFQFIYFAIRYKLCAALAAALADVHNFAIFISLLAITRTPVSSSIVAFAALCVVVTMIGCAFLFDRSRKNLKDETYNSLDQLEQADVCARESFLPVCAVPAVICAMAVIFFVLLSISAMSVFSVLIPVLAAILLSLSCVYGTLFFTPAVYARFKRIGDGYKQKRLARRRESARAKK